jgi:MoxR-like ATPase
MICRCLCTFCHFWRSSLTQIAAIESIDQVQQALAGRDYISERSLATAIFLALRMGRPLFLEGEAGVGKTEIAKVLATILDRQLIRLQCYEGLDIHTAVYEWNYSRQMLQIRLLEAAGNVSLQNAQHELFSSEFLLKRPLLQAIDYGTQKPPVLLIDELDRADEEFEAFLLELLSDFQITIPELGTIKAPVPPVVIITSNRTREIHDALKRRCLYHWIDYPSFEKEYTIVHARAPHAPEFLARQVVAFVQRLRQEELYKYPGVAETLDWIAALVTLDQQELTEELVTDTLGTLLKYQDDIRYVHRASVRQLLAQAVATIP